MLALFKRASSLTKKSGVWKSFQSPSNRSPAITKERRFFSNAKIDEVAHRRPRGFARELYRRAFVSLETTKRAVDVKISGMNETHGASAFCYHAQVVSPSAELVGLNDLRQIVSRGYPRSLPLPRSFFERDARIVARALIGAHLVTQDRLEKAASRASSKPKLIVDRTTPHATRASVITLANARTLRPAGSRLCFFDLWNVRLLQRRHAA